MSGFNTILEFSDIDLTPQYKMHDISKFATREAARGLVFDGSKIAIIEVANYNFHKFPGGGIEKGESIEDAFKREVKEEIGCDCIIDQTIGKIVEYRDKFNLKQINYIFTANVLGDIGQPSLEPDEIIEGFVIDWKTPQDILEVLKNDRPSNYEGNFIIKRDLCILETYLG